ncbi:MAG: SAM-dependent methyltransferase [Lachnospiraceae bacterium]|nr:SAM-dependent methyltransferase [Lachnospiraceae bacterium]
MDERIVQVFEKYIDDSLEQVTISNSTDPERMTKVRIRPVELAGKIAFQTTEYVGTKVFHKNHTRDDLMALLPAYFEGLFLQAELKAEGRQATVMISRKGTVTVKEKRTAKTAVRDLAHNREKHYILEEGRYVPFLADLGVMTREGKIVSQKYDKFRQINRYREFIEDILPVFDRDRELRIIDFGCGKSYLTFAMYYYLHELKGYNISVTGLDLKADVIAHCNGLAQSYGYDNLRFLHGDIADYECSGNVDMVVTLHACDTATDYALDKAMGWGAKVIFCVPCCQHEVNKSIRTGRRKSGANDAAAGGSPLSASEALESAFKYGLIKERMSALITDAIRANILEDCGYRTQILEFIDMEHTPKNILIRAVRSETGKHGGTGDLSCAALMVSLGIDQTLYELTKKRRCGQALPREEA